jgi:hypothetical protein
MGCRIPLTGTDTRHNPGKNFEKPFVTWPRRRLADAAARRVGGGRARQRAESGCRDRTRLPADAVPRGRVCNPNAELETHPRGMPARSLRAPRGQSRAPRGQSRAPGVRPELLGSDPGCARTAGQARTVSGIAAYDDCGPTRHWPVCGPLPASSVTWTRTILAAVGRTKVIQPATDWPRRSRTGFSAGR